MELCLGTVQFGIKYGINSDKQPTKEECFAMLDQALKSGITTFDTAKCYGTSQQILGEYFKGKKRDSFKIATKLESKAEGDEMFTAYEEEIKESLKILGLDYVDFYLSHNAERINDEKAIKAIYSLKEKGYTKKVGISVYTPDEAMLAIKNPFIDCVQIPYNVIDKRLDKMGFFDIAKTSGKTVFCRSIMLQGLLAMKVEDAVKKLPESEKTLIDYENLCKEYNLSKVEFAVSYIAKKGVINYCVFGVDNIEQLKEQIRMKNIDFPSDAIKKADEIFSNVPVKVLDPRQWNK